MLMYVCICLYESITSEAVVRRYSVRKDVLGSFTKFTGKHLSQSLFFNKVAGQGLEVLILRNSPH